jgi:hypothetical protein
MISGTAWTITYNDRRLEEILKLDLDLGRTRKYPNPDFVPI